MSLEIRQAKTQDLPAVLAILNEISAWTASVGSVQWPLPWPEDYIAGIIEMGEMYLVYQGSQSHDQSSSPAIATFALRSSDEEPWGIQPPDAFYVHHLAVRRSVSGQSIGPKLLAWCANYARSHGKDYLRLDCVASNHFLQSYYKKAGFLHIGHYLNPQSPHKLCLFEMDLARNILQ